MDVYLYGLRSLRGLWGFCVREMFGGFMACGVFALPFISLPLFLSLFQLPLLVLLSSAYPLSLRLILGFLSFGVVVSFSLTDYTQKRKGRNSLRPLLSCCWLSI